MNIINKTTVIPRAIPRRQNENTGKPEITGDNATSCYLMISKKGRKRK
jgi:hypothetical protein